LLYLKGTITLLTFYIDRCALQVKQRFVKVRIAGNQYGFRIAYCRKKSIAVR